MNLSNWHIINKNEVGSVGICEDRYTFLITFKHLQIALNPLEMAFFKDYMSGHQDKFQWFTTLLDVKALIRVEQLGIEFVLDQDEIEQMIQLLTETQIIIESRLLTLPKIKAGGLNG